MRNHALAAALAVMTLAAPAAAQDTVPVSADTTAPATAVKEKKSMAPAITIQHVRPQDKRGLHMFEAPKNDAIPYNGFKLDFGAAFTQQFQNLEHSNTAEVVPAPGNTALMEIGNGFNTAVGVVIGVYVLGLGWDNETLVRSVIWLVPLGLVAFSGRDAASGLAGQVALGVSLRDNPFGPDARVVCVATWEEVREVLARL